MNLSRKFVIEVWFPVGVRWFAGASDEDEADDLNTTNEEHMAARFDSQISAGRELNRLAALHPDRPFRVRPYSGGPR